MRKKIFALLMLVLSVVTILTGCAKAQESVSEPDTDGRTQSHMIVGKYRKIVYSFHMKKTDEGKKTNLSAFLISDDKEDPFDADNYCTVNIGDDGSYGFKTHHRRGLEYSDRWITSKNPSEWKMEEPYASMGEINEADVTITYIRNGKSIRVLADIDGERAWQGDGGVKHLKNKEVYIYLTSENYTLTNIQYQDMGFTFVIPPIVYVVLIILGIIAIFAVHTFAKIGEVKLYDVDAPIFCTLISTAFTVCLLGLGLIIFGRTHPDALNKMFFDYITVQLSASGPGFWVPTVIFAVGAIGLAIAIANMAIGVNNCALGILYALGLGVLHTLWYYTLANIIIQSVDKIFEMIMIVVVIFVIGSVSEHSIIKSYHVYSKNGYVGTVYTLESTDDNEKDTKK